MNYELLIAQLGQQLTDGCRAQLAMELKRANKDEALSAWLGLSGAFASGLQACIPGCGIHASTPEKMQGGMTAAFDAECQLFNRSARVAPGLIEAILSNVFGPGQFRTRALVGVYSTRAEFGRILVLMYDMERMNMVWWLRGGWAGQAQDENEGSWLAIALLDPFYIQPPKPLIKPQTRQQSQTSPNGSRFP